MSSLQTFTPDDIYCVFCHARAAGRCATCHALICADCAELTGGAVQKAAVCQECAARGEGRVGLREWWSLLSPIVLLLLGMAFVAALLVLLLGL